MIHCHECRTPNKMNDRSLWRDWKLVARLVFTPEPEFTAQLLCGPCGAAYAAQHPRTKTLCFPVGTGDVDAQLRQLEREQTDLLRQSGYTLAAWQAEHSAHRSTVLTNPFAPLNAQLGKLAHILEDLSVDPDQAIAVMAHFLNVPSRTPQRCPEAPHETGSTLQHNIHQAFTQLETVLQSIEKRLAASETTAPLAGTEAPAPRTLPARNGPTAPARSQEKRPPLLVRSR